MSKSLSIVWYNLYHYSYKKQNKKNLHQEPTKAKRHESFSSLFSSVRRIEQPPLSILTICTTKLGIMKKFTQSITFIKSSSSFLPYIQPHKTFKANVTHHLIAHPKLMYTFRNKNIVHPVLRTLQYTQHWDGRIVIICVE